MTYYDGCIQLPPTRCIEVPSFIALALIVPENHSVTRKYDINLFSQ